MLGRSLRQCNYMEVLSYKDKPTNLVARAWKSILYVYILPFPTPVQVDKTFSINTSYAFYHFPILEGGMGCWNLSVGGKLLKMPESNDSRMLGTDFRKICKDYREHCRRSPKIPKEDPKMTAAEMEWLRKQPTFRGARTVLYGLLPGFVCPSVITMRTFGLSLRCPPASVNSWLLANSMATSVRVIPEVYGMPLIRLVMASGVWWATSANLTATWASEWYGMIPIRVPWEEICNLCTKDMTNSLAFSKFISPTEPERSIMTATSIARLQEEGGPGAVVR